MTETRDFQPQFDMQVTPVNTEADFANYDAVLAAEAILAEEVATQEIVTGAENLLQEEATVAQEQSDNTAEFSMNMVRIFMLLSQNKENEQARSVVAGAIALDTVGREHGIKEFTFANAVAARQYAGERETERLLRARDEDDDTED